MPVETGKFGGTEVTLHLQPFLTEQELTTLRLVLTNEQALAKDVDRLMSEWMDLSSEGAS